MSDYARVLEAFRKVEAINLKRLFTLQTLIRLRLCSIKSPQVKRK